VTATRRQPTARLRAVGKRAADCSWQRRSSDLEGEQSPWEERAKRCRQRHRIATDSLVEKRLEIEASSGEALTTAFGNEQRRRGQNLRSACATGSRPGLPGTDLLSARRFHQVTPTTLRRGRGTSRAKRTVFGRKRGTARTTSASLLADDVLGAQPTTTSVVRGKARDDVGGCFGDSEHRHQEARIFAPSRTSVC
jgi:hypothetical protein